MLPGATPLVVPELGNMNTKQAHGLVSCILWTFFITFYSVQIQYFNNKLCYMASPYKLSTKKHQTCKRQPDSRNYMCKILVRSKILRKLDVRGYFGAVFLVVKY